MTNEEHIDSVLGTLRATWLSMPQLRLGQLLCAAVGQNHLWHATDHEVALELGLLQDRWTVKQ
jgi:hypothetical protein